MSGKTVGRPHHTYLRGGRRKKGEQTPPPAKRARNRAWSEGQKGHGAEGYSRAYGGSRGAGTGPSGPDTED
jgi:hypothetical protein